MDITLYPEWISKLNRHRARGRLLASGQVLRPGLVGNVCAGRTLSLADFPAARGFDPPRALWGMSDLLDATGNGFNLTVATGSVPTATGIEGVPGTARQFNGASYLTAPNAVKHAYGSVGFWFKTGRVVVTSSAMVTWQSATAIGAMRCTILGDGRFGSFQQCAGSSGYWQSAGYGRKRLDDNRWHFVTVTWDGMRLITYIDGELEAPDGFAVSAPWRGPSNLHATDPLTFGCIWQGSIADPYTGLLDEVFLTEQVLKLEHHRWLMAAKMAYPSWIEPTNVEMTVENHAPTSLYVAGDFTTQPLVGYNFTAGALTTDNYGSLGRTLTPLPDAAAPKAAPDVDGASSGGVFLATGVHYTASDTGLPTGTSPSTIGVWAQIGDTSGTFRLIFKYGVRRAIYYDNGSGLAHYDGGWNGAGATGGDHNADGGWHFFVLVSDSSAFDGASTKMYVDGLLVQGGWATLTLVSTLAGASGLLIGGETDGSLSLNGTLASAFITNYAMTPEQVIGLWAKQGMPLDSGPAEPSAFVEAITDTHLYVIHDTIDPRATVTYRIAA